MAIETSMSADAVRTHRFWSADLEGLPLDQQVRVIELSERAASLPPASGKGASTEEVLAMIDGFRPGHQVQQ